MGLNLSYSDSPKFAIVANLLEESSLSVKEIAQIADVAEKTVYRWVAGAGGPLYLEDRKRRLAMHGLQNLPDEVKAHIADSLIEHDEPGGDDLVTIIAPADNSSCQALLLKETEPQEKALPEAEPVPAEAAVLEEPREINSEIEALPELRRGDCYNLLTGLSQRLYVFIEKFYKQEQRLPINRHFIAAFGHSMSGFPVSTAREAFIRDNPQLGLFAIISMRRTGLRLNKEPCPNWREVFGRLLPGAQAAYRFIEEGFAKTGEMPTFLQTKLDGNKYGITCYDHARQAFINIHSPSGENLVPSVEKDESKSAPMPLALAPVSKPVPDPQESLKELCVKAGGIEVRVPCPDKSDLNAVLGGILTTIIKSGVNL